MIDFETGEYWLRVYVRRQKLPPELPRLPVAIACLALAFLVSCVERLAG